MSRRSLSRNSATVQRGWSSCASTRSSLHSRTWTWSTPSSKELTTMMRFAIATALAAAAVLAAGSGARGAPTDPSWASPDFNQKAADYCVHTAGVVETRVAVYGSNGPNLLFLGGVRQFCQYTARDGSRIHLLTSTLFSQKP